MIDDLTKREDVIRLMKSSKSEREWNDNCDRVKLANDGKYPTFWFNEIIVSGLLAEVQMRNHFR